MPPFARRAFSLAILAAGLAVAAPAAASGPCQAAAPAVGASFRGPVLHVIDGARLCVARGDTPDKWVELELAQNPLQRAASRPAPTRGALMSAAFARDVDCRIVGRKGAVATAVCTADGQDLSQQSVQPAAFSAGQAWR